MPLKDGPGLRTTASLAFCADKKPSSKLEPRHTERPCQQPRSLQNAGFAACFLLPCLAGSCLLPLTLFRYTLGPSLVPSSLTRPPCCCRQGSADYVFIYLIYTYIYIYIYMFMCVIYVIQSQYPMCPGLLNINDYKPNLFRSHFLIQHCWNESGVEAIGATAWSLRRWRAQSPRVAAPTRSQALWAMVGLYIWG